MSLGLRRTLYAGWKLYVYHLGWVRSLQGCSQFFQGHFETTVNLEGSPVVYTQSSVVFRDHGRGSKWCCAGGLRS